ncbi:PAS domain S-box protein [Humisphaera borealis]|uniref:histidine kinase n=1 Tax=Humisphaera borealis TaxID=2807512 RepID=A0A7M2X2T2_9BACT|nr:PAS domain S-box protein [Humisphaera borealis]QOV91341.1 PAS domain S-box protein [Humisphaera borealis]
MSICLGSRFPMMLWWGPDLINIYNDAFIPVLGGRHPQALGESGRDVWTETWPVIGSQVAKVMEEGGSTLNERVRLVYTRHGYPEETWFTWSFGPIYDESGRVAGLFNTCHEDTLHVLAERERDRLATQRQLALDAARLGWWHYNPVTRLATFDERYKEIFGVSGNQRPNEEILKRLHPDDLPGVWSKVEAALNPTDPKPYSVEYRIILDDGSVRWVDAHGTATFEGEGADRRATSFVGTVADITDRKRVTDQSRTILESISDAFFALDREWKFTYLNPQAERVLGRSSVDLIGRVIWEEYRMDGTEFDRVFRRAATGRVAASITAFYPEHNRWYEVNAYPAPDGVSVYFRDATERVQAEELLRRSHDTFYHLIQNNPFGVYVVDADFKLRQVSLGSQKVFATVPPPLVGRDFAEVLRFVWAEPFATEAVARFRHTLDTGEPYASARTVELRQDIGAVEVYDWRIERITLPDGRFGVVCYFYDLSERQQWEVALAESRRKLDSALIAGEVGTFEWDVVNDRLWGDRNFQRIFGIELDASGAAPLATYVAAIHAADRERVLEHVRRSVETGSDYAAEYRVTSEIPPRWVTARGKVERDEAGRAIRFPGVVLDVTERKQAELLLAAQNRALERMATGEPLSEALGVLTQAVEEQSGGGVVAAILLVDKDGCTLRTGAAPSLPAEYSAALDGIKAASGLGTCADAVARNKTVITPDLAVAPSWKGLAHLPLALGLKAAWSMPIRAPDGRLVGTFGTYFRERREPTKRERQVVEGLCRVAALAVDRRRADTALRESEELVRTIAENSTQGMAMMDARGYCTYANHAWLDMTGYSAEEIRSMPLHDLVHHHHPDGRPYPRDQCPIERALPEKLDVRAHEDLFFRKDGASFPVLVAASPIFDDGTPVSTVIEIRDVTGAKRAEAERERLLDSERAARIEAERAGRMKDEFLATLSHELRTPLNAILGWSQILAHGANDANDLAEGLRVIERNARAQTQIIEDLLDMSRIISGKVRLDVQRVDLGELIRLAVETTKPSADAKAIRLQTTLDPHAGPASGDPARLQQVLWNLLSNAVKFTPKGGRVAVRLERVNSHAEVSVIDSGEGIPKEFLPHVFDRFRQADATTTRRHGGLGLGLSIVKQLVELHGGSVQVKSAGVGQGTIFTVSLPLAAVQPGPNPDTDRHQPRAFLSNAVSPDACAQLAGIKVLVVDDEADARALVRRLLEDCEATVVTAGSAATALEVVRTERPDVLICDIGMPDEDGYTFIRRVRAMGPEHGGQVPAAALTAYARIEDRVRAIRAGFQLHLVKPVEPAELIATVAALARRSGQIDQT